MCWATSFVPLVLGCKLLAWIFVVFLGFVV